MAAGTLHVLQAGAAEIVPEGGLEEKLELGRPLRVKLGVDPSRPDLTLGHTVVLRKLREFQDAGHVAVLIIGDFTARIGDPSGQSETRPMLSAEEVEANAETYLAQAGKVIDVAGAEIHGNAEWTSTMDMGGLLRLTSSATVAQMLEREDFRARYRDGKPISVVELLYPLFQAQDSVAIDADVELGGTDQTFNLLMGREVQRAYGREPQVVLTLPLLEGLDGVRKMSKSLDNYVALTDPPEGMFGKLMSIPDELIAKYELLCTDLGSEDHARVTAGLADRSIHPNEEKRRMARTIVDLYHGPGAGEAAEARFDQVFRRHEIPPDVPEVRIDRARVFLESKPGVVQLQMASLLVELGLAESTSEARRLLAQGAVRRDGERVTQEQERFTTEPDRLVGTTWQVGKRRFARVAEIINEPAGAPRQRPSDARRPREPLS
jgi:tyrosyl-tRNA synthetase